jgi:hypothetical protein
MNRRRVILRNAGLAALALFAAIQFVPVNRSNPSVRTEVKANDTVMTVLRHACYDCHSNETRWPWYSYVAPASWFVAGHVHRGRADLNFSEWDPFDFEVLDDVFHGIEEQVSSGQMPLRSYTLLHPEARLDPQGREILLDWARSQRIGEE